MTTKYLVIGKAIVGDKTVQRVRYCRTLDEVKDEALAMHLLGNRNTGASATAYLWDGAEGYADTAPRARFVTSLQGKVSRDTWSLDLPGRLRE